jgi:aryl-alcohol dehydrogenase-like predicted oxidoreductase
METMSHNPELSSRKLGSTGLTCHPLGFGCYRIYRGNRQHEEALRAYLDRGGNLIDTSANYGDGLSEALVGQVIRDYSREKIVVVTKGGYIQGENMKLALKEDFPEIVRYGDGLWHCIHPEFLRSQIRRSLERMQLRRVDIYLLHNPEYFLTDRAHRGVVSAVDHDAFYRRIGEAFRFLERQADEGTISWYGISSNNFGLPDDDSTATSVARCMEEARRVSRDNRFRAIQLPMNLYERGGALEVNSDGKTALEFCQAENLGVLINRPLNAFSRNRLIRLADFTVPGQALPGQDALSNILEPLFIHEQRIARELQLPLLRGGGLAGLIRELVPQLQSQSHWEQAAGKYVVEPLQAWLKQMQERFAGDMRWQAWVQDLAVMVNPLFEEVGRLLAAREQVASDSVRDALSRAGYPDSGESLSRIAISILLNTPGVSCVLNGMRRIKYVEDAMGAAEIAPVKGVEILRRLNALRLL